jgi:glycosyltransferase involved in cell wall biosynthesis
MRVAILADGRSPITRGWLSALSALNYELHLISTFPCKVDLPLASSHMVPIAFSGFDRRKAGTGSSALGGAAGIRTRAALKRWLGMATFPSAVRRLRATLQALDVDVLHALRIPYEGMLAAETDTGMPLILSVWGNDFTLHARSTPWMGWLTKRAVTRAQALHADCQRDIRMAREWGLAEGLPTLVAPGGGGLDRAIFHPGSGDLKRLRPELQVLEHTLTTNGPVVINPRGFRTYVRNDTFFQAVPRILEEIPEAVFIAPAMLGERPAEQWITRLGIRDSVILLPQLTPVEMAVLYQRSQIMVSPSEHDGTPNSFLEAIACGCFPVVGDLESLREWVQEGINGYLVDPGDPGALGDAVVGALRDEGLRAQASASNQVIIDERAERSRVVGQLDQFYKTVLMRENPTQQKDDGGP